MSILQKISDVRYIKDNIRQAIIDSGTSVSEVEPLSGYAAKINAITVIPSGTLYVTDNNTYNVVKYADCVVEGSKLYLKREIDNNIFQHSSTNFTFSLPNNVTDIDSYGMSYAFNGCTSLTSVDLSNLTTINGTYGMQFAFRECANLTSVDLSNLTAINGSYGMRGVFSICTSLTSVSFPKLTTINCDNGMSYIFQDCTSLTSVDLSNLTTINGSYGMSYAFNGCTSLTSVDLSNLTAINGSSAMSTAFSGCTSLTSVSFPKLTTINGDSQMSYAFNNCNNLTTVDLSSLTTVSGSNAMNCAFQNCTSLITISFPKLKDFGNSYTNQFYNMLRGCSNVVMHFRYDMEDKVKALTGYSATAPFGASSGTVLFDLARAELEFHVDSESTVSIYIDGELQS